MMGDEFINPRTPIYSNEEITNVALAQDSQYKQKIVDHIIGEFNLKLDTYDRVTAGIVQLLDTGDKIIEKLLVARLSRLISEENQQHGRKVFLTKAVHKLTQERPLFVIRYLEDLFNELSKSTHGYFSHWSDVDKLKIKINAIKLIRRAEHARGGRLTKIQENQLEELCISALSSPDDETKIDTLIFVLDSRETTKPIDDLKLSIFVALLQEAVGLQQPALRQIFIAQTCKLLKRINDSYRVVLRDTKRYDQQDRAIITLRYTGFLRWLVTFSINSIYCKSYFGNFVLATSSIQLVIKTIEIPELQASISILLASRRCCDSVLSCVSDSFEENKMKAIETLMMLPSSESYEKEITNIAYELTSSVNPAQSLTCQYLFKLLRYLERKSADDDAGFKHLNNLVRDLEECLISTSDDILPYISAKPIHSKLACIKAVLEEVDLKIVIYEKNKWRILVHKIVELSIKACHAVAAVVCNLNPETVGHLPMDIQPVDISYLLGTMQISPASHDNFSTMTSQMLLICGWKTIKECALSLGTICNRFWWPVDCSQFLLSSYPQPWVEPVLSAADIYEIIKFFEHYLMNLRHRGAFEQAYNGFLMVTKQIWHELEFRELLVDMLDELMTDFREESLDEKKRETLKAYTTRRSAGLPFLVQAILNTEFAHSSRVLRSVMSCLFEVLESRTSEDYQKVHCLNILRALMKDHHLGEKVVNYIGRTFEVTLEMLQSTSFPIKNCSIMLLKANMDRTFGVNRSRDHIYRQNCLSYESFFSCCPSLRSKMLEILKVDPSKPRYYASIRAVFTILLRLVTSKTQDDDYKRVVMIKPFFNQSLRIAYHCPDFKLRQMAARLAVHLESFLRRDNLGELHPMYLIVRVISGDNNSDHGIIELITRRIELDKSWSIHDDSTYNYKHIEAVISEVLSAHDSRLSLAIKCAALNLAENFYLHSDRPKGWLIEIASSLLDSALVEITSESSNRPNPFEESYILQLITLILLSNTEELVFEDPNLEKSLSILIHLIKMKPDRSISTSLQACLIRFLRHQVTGVLTFTERLTDKLEVDSTAALVGPGDKMKIELVKRNNPDISATIVKKDRALREFLMSRLSRLQELFDLSQYSEFQLEGSSSSAFRPRTANTARATELLALAYDCWNLMKVFNHELVTSRLSLMIKFISDLPDCDVRCTAVLYSSRLMTHCFSHGFWEATCEYTQVLSELANQNHSLTLREVCCEVIDCTIIDTLRCATVENQACRTSLINLLRALVKLCHDEDPCLQEHIRSTLIKLAALLEQSGRELPLLNRSRIDSIIHLATKILFNPNSIEEASDCFELLMGAMFVHLEDNPSCLLDENDRLFYGSQPDNYVNFVKTIQSCHQGLVNFLESRRKDLPPVDLDRLVLPESLKRYYSDSHEELSEGFLDSDQHTKATANQLTNSQLVDKIIEDVLERLKYFSTGYKSMLVDPNYTYREFCLFKRIACIVTVVKLTKLDLQNFARIDKIRSTLFQLVREKSATSILSKCHEIIQL